MEQGKMTLAWEWVKHSKVIAIVRGLEPVHMLKLAESFVVGGVDLIEVTFNQSQPETWQDTARAIQAMSRELAGQVLAGAGTVLTEEQLRIAADAGAQYIITPHTDASLIRSVKRMGLLSFPGALTPSEILTAYQAGADAIKVFPAGELGLSYMKAIRAPLNHIPMMAVGGVDEKNAANFLKAGCMGIGVGGNLVRKDWITEGKWDKLTELARAYRKAVE